MATIKARMKIKFNKITALFDACAGERWFKNKCFDVIDCDRCPVVNEGGKMKQKKVTEGIGQFFVGECECPPHIATLDNRDLSLADLLPDDCVDYPFSREFMFKITIETEVK